MKLAHESEWRVNQRRSLTERRFYVDYVQDERRGKLGLVMDNLLQREAELLVDNHNRQLKKGADNA